MPDFTVSLTESELATLLALGDVRGVDANTVIKQAIGTEKLIAENVGTKDELLIRRGNSNTFAKFEFGPAR